MTLPIIYLILLLVSVQFMRGARIVNHSED